MPDEITDVKAEQTEVEQETVTKAVEAEPTPVKTFTEKELNERIAKTQSTFETKAAVARREADEARKEVERYAREHADIVRRMAEIEAEKDREWEETVGNTQEGQTLIAARRRLKAQEQALVERERVAAERSASGEWGLKAANAMEFGTLYGVDYKLLLSEKTPADMKAKALEIALENERAKRTEPEKETPSVTPAHVDSGVVTTRSSKALTKESLNKLYAEGDIDFLQYQEGLKKV